MAKPNIQDLRLSFIWVRTFLDAVLPEPPRPAPPAFAGSFDAYAGHFANIQQHGTLSSGLGFSWLTPTGQKFWTRYLEESTLNRLSAKRAWELVVPFRAHVPVEVAHSGVFTRFSLEAFYYPHGVGLVLTAVCQETLSLQKAVIESLGLRKGEAQFKWARRSRVLSLEGLPNYLFDMLQEKALGSLAIEGRQSPTPFTVATVVRGTGVSTGESLAADGEIHRALQALAEWHTGWESDLLPALNAARLAINPGSPPSDIFYGTKRGRVIWFPSLFTMPRSDIHSLACYHRNHVLATLQVESLARLLAEAKQRLASGRPLTGVQQDAVQRAAEILGRLYGGSASIYRTHSVRRQIQQNDFLESINEIRGRHNLPLLSA